MSVIRFDIRHANGQKEAMVIEAERALIGSGAHCDVRLAVDQAAAEAVAIDVIDGIVYAEALAPHPPVTISGAPFAQVAITPELPLRVGATYVFIVLAEGSLASAPKKKSGGVSPITLVAAVVGLAGLAYMLLSGDEQTIPSAPAQPPNLFATAPSPCPQTAPDEARSFALEKLDIAEGKRERSPFVPREGVQAVQLYEMARACFQRAGDTAHAAEADADARQLRAAVTQDFRARLIRLEHMMAAGDYELASRDATALRELTEGERGPWVTWLASTSRILKQKGPQS